eukprot:1974557-Rhodomonas_salina.3
MLGLFVAVFRVFGIHIRGIRGYSVVFGTVIRVFGRPQHARAPLVSVRGGTLVAAYAISVPDIA